MPLVGPPIIAIIQGAKCGLIKSKKETNRQVVIGACPCCKEGIVVTLHYMDDFVGDGTVCGADIEKTADYRE